MQALPFFHIAILRHLVFFTALVVLDSVRSEAAAAGQTQKVAAVANAFLDTLDNTQRGKVSFAYRAVDGERGQIEVIERDEGIGPAKSVLMSKVVFEMSARQGPRR